MKVELSNEEIIVIRASLMALISWIGENTYKKDIMMQIINKLETTN